MAFCTQCGSRLQDDARFCPNCGKPVGAVQTAVLQPLDYTIHGDNLQVVRIRLKPGQEIYAEAGKMLYKTANVQWDSRMSGAGLGSKLLGALKRKLAGESLFWTYFRADSPGEVGFAGPYPGRIQAFELGPGQSVLVQRDAFLCAQDTVQVGIEFVKRVGAGFFAGEGFILERLTGPGTVFIHAGGDFVEFDLKPGETLQVDTGCVVAFDPSVSYDVQFAGGIKTWIFGGEGLFLATLTGPGRVIVQSMTLEKMRRELMPARTGGDERSGLGSLTNLLGSED
ncbi:MAG: TIGR00266 family protein [Bryobacterales bacterium]|nr:TIGR00266 family protein [Bryobacteraceae bacterium]MDW8354230.1 TIGR00266 family protein [Bryobacterales bacterium]